MITPIEAMIDAACGFDREAYRREQAAIRGHDADGEWLILFCPSCGRFMADEHGETDPPKATLLELKCEQCNHGDFDSPGYWDGAGRELGPDDWPEACR